MLDIKLQKTLECLEIGVPTGQAGRPGHLQCCLTMCHPRKAQDQNQGSLCWGPRALTLEEMSAGPLLPAAVCPALITQ